MAELRLKESDYAQGEAYCLHRLAVTDRPHSGFGDLTHSYGSRRENPQAHTILLEACDMFEDIQNVQGGVSIKLNAMEFLAYVDRMGLHGSKIVDFFNAMPVDNSLRISAFTTYVFGAKHRRSDATTVNSFLADDVEGRKRRLSTCVRELGTVLNEDVSSAFLQLLALSDTAEAPNKPGAARQSASSSCQSGPK